MTLEEFHTFYFYQVETDYQQNKFLKLIGYIISEDRLILIGQTGKGYPLSYFYSLETSFQLEHSPLIFCIYRAKPMQRQKLLSPRSNSVAALLVPQSY